ncbi:MAG TPA: TRAP transporter large permease subunit [Bryobacteraceae bacterium]|nr:TRAP transporter large permease subunit [Bryobacteraceae bacterium]
MGDLGVGVAILALLFALLLTGLWIFVAILLTGAAILYFVSSFSLPRIGLNMYPILMTKLTSYDFASLPLFVWMAEIIFRSRISDGIFQGLAPWLTRVPGRLLHVNVLGCGLFGSVSGSSAATCATIAKIALPELKRRGYDERVALGSLAGAATLGILIPPSITMVIYALAADVSLVRLFLAGFLPGLLVILLYSGYIAVWALLHPDRMPPRESSTTFRERIVATKHLFPTFALILGIVVVLVMGWVSPSECAAVGVAGAFVLAWLSGGFTWNSFKQSITGTVQISCMIVLILAASAFMSSALSYSGLPAKLAGWVGSLDLSTWALIAVLLLIYAILGTAVDGVSLIVLTMPVVLPLVIQAKIDLIWFGIFMILVIEMSEVTPPVGFSLFVLQAMSGRDSFYVGAAALPFFILLAVAVALITVFPQIVMVLPDAAFAR